MTKEPFFSIVIPTNNSSDHIRACLDSIARQTCPDLELIIIDNKSEDDTLKMAAYFADQIKIRTVSEKDHGVYDAMNKGLNLAKGNYVYFLGADDTFYNEHVLQRIRETAQRTNSALIYGNVMMRGKHPRIADQSIHAGEFDLKRLISHNICHQAVFYRRDIFENVGNYNLRYPVYADHDLNLRCAAKYQFIYTDLTIANFNLGGISSKEEDATFEQDKYRNIFNYFFNRLHTRTFVDLRLYVQQAALSPKSGLGPGSRLYCLLIYFKLKLHSLLL